MEHISFPDLELLLFLLLSLWLGSVYSRVDGGAGDGRCCCCCCSSVGGDGFRGSGWNRSSVRVGVPSPSRNGHLLQHYLFVHKFQVLPLDLTWQTSSLV